MEYKKPTRRMKQTPEMLAERRKLMQEAAMAHFGPLAMNERVMVDIAAWSIETFLEIEDAQKRRILGLKDEE